MYPEAVIPVVQISLDYTKAPRYHYDLAKELLPLRDQNSGRFSYYDFSYDQLNSPYLKASESRLKANSYRSGYCIKRIKLNFGEFYVCIGYNS